MAITTSTNLDYLIDALRLEMGDTDSTNYRYLDEWLRTTLVESVKALQRWWNYKYLITEEYNAYRNPYGTFLFPEPPTIQNCDERAIIVMSAIILKAGTLENNAWSSKFGSWKDNEISYSNIESGSIGRESLKRSINELYDLLKPPTKRLVWAKKISLIGFKDNDYETNKDM